jgi:hypothetical protein
MSTSAEKIEGGEAEQQWCPQLLVIVRCFDCEIFESLIVRFVFYCDTM